MVSSAKIEMTANVFMGLTLGCARCHDHKYDPISQKDYYRFFAFFNTIAAPNPVSFNYGGIDPPWEKGVFRLIQGFNAGIGITF